MTSDKSDDRCQRLATWLTTELNKLDPEHRAVLGQFLILLTADYVRLTTSCSHPSQAPSIESVAKSILESQSTNPVKGEPIFTLSPETQAYLKATKAPFEDFL